MTDEAQVPQEAENTETTSTETGNWYSDDYKDIVEKKGWGSGDDVLKSYRELEQMASGKVKLPEDDAAWAAVLESDEQKAALRKRLGIAEPPKSVEEYGIEVDESIAGLRNEAIENTMKTVALEAGIQPSAFSAIVQSYYKTMAEGMAKSYEEGQTALRDELGDKYEESLKIAQRFTENASPEFRTLLEETGLGNNPTFIKEFIALGKKTMSDSIIKGTNSVTEDPNWKPAYPDSPEMYATGEDDESVKARAYFSKRGHKY